METSTVTLDGNGDAKLCTEPKGSAANRDGLTCSVYAEFGQKSKILGCFGGMVISHAVHLRNRIGGGKTSVQFRRFSSSTPTRLADGLGPKRFTPRCKAIRPDNLGPPFSKFSEIRLTLWLSYPVVVVKAF